MITKKRVFKDIAEGMEIPSLSKKTSTMVSAKWAAASGDFDPIHYDREYAIAYGLPSTIVNGRFKVAILCQLITTFAYPKGKLIRLAVKHHGMDAVGNNVVCKGTIIRKYRKDDSTLIDCDIWIENDRGEKTSSGSATIMFLSEIL